VDLSGASAARSADSLILLPPLPPDAQRCAFTAELSIKTCAGGPPAEARVRTHKDSLVCEYVIHGLRQEATRIAMLFNPATAPGGGMSYVRIAEAAARASQIVAMPVGSVDDINRSMDQFAAQPNGGLIVVPDSFTNQNAELIVAAAARNRLPAVYPIRNFSTAGGLVSYGVDAAVQARQAATYIDRILRGEKVSGLPVQAPNKFDLVINLKTAKTLGLSVPLTLQVAADEVID
jgi:putative ABC transport system substrate-binding protein